MKNLPSTLAAISAGAILLSGCSDSEEVAQAVASVSHCGAKEVAPGLLMRLSSYSAGIPSDDIWIVQLCHPERGCSAVASYRTGWLRSRTTMILASRSPSLWRLNSKCSMMRPGFKDSAFPYLSKPEGSRPLRRRMKCDISWDCRPARLLTTAAARIWSSGHSIADKASIRSPLSTLSRRSDRPLWVDFIPGLWPSSRAVAVVVRYGWVVDTNFRRCLACLAGIPRLHKPTSRRSFLLQKKSSSRKLLVLGPVLAGQSSPPTQAWMTPSTPS